MLQVVDVVVVADDDVAEYCVNYEEKVKAKVDEIMSTWHVVHERIDVEIWVRSCAGEEFGIAV